MTPVLWYVTAVITLAAALLVWAVFDERRRQINYAASLETVETNLARVEGMHNQTRSRLNQLGHLFVALDEAINGTDEPTGRHAHGATRADSVSSSDIDAANKEQK